MVLLLVSDRIIQMANEPQKRAWWQITRVQGLFIAAGGIAMLFNPLTSPYAGQVIAIGLGWVAGGVNANETRKTLDNNK